MFPESFNCIPAVSKVWKILLQCSFSLQPQKNKWRTSKTAPALSKTSSLLASRAAGLYFQSEFFFYSRINDKLGILVFFIILFSSLHQSIPRVKSHNILCAYTLLSRPEIVKVVEVPSSAEPSEAQNWD